MSILSPNIFYWGSLIATSGGGTSAADPQLQFFENFPGHLGAVFAGFDDRLCSFQAVNIPLHISFNKIFYLASMSHTASQSHSRTVQFGLYSLNNGTLSLANSAGMTYTGSHTNANGASWFSMATSATQNITPGTWYFGFNISSGGGNSSNWRPYANSSINPANAIPGAFLMGRITAVTGALPVSYATSNLDITGADATRHPYIIITS